MNAQEVIQYAKLRISRDRVKSPTLNFSFHTIELTLELTAVDYKKVLKTLLTLKCETWSKDWNHGCIWSSKVFQSRGVSVQLAQINTLNGDSQYCYHAISLRVNPRILIGDSSYIGIYVNTSSENERLILALNECLSQIGLTEYFSLEFGRPCLCTIEDFHISRLDLCVNYKLPSAFLLSRYLKLMRRGNRPSFLTEKVTYDSVAKRQLPHKHALSLSASSFDISIYDKVAQMEDNIAFFKEIPPVATGVLRFEIQLRREKLRRLLQQLPDTSLSTVLTYTPTLCRSEFGRYTKSLFCTENYYTLQDAKALIVQHETPCSAYKKIKFLEDVSANRSLQQTIKEYERENKSCRYLLDGLAKLGINPVTIPERWFGPHAFLHSIPALLGFCPLIDLEQIQGQHFG